ncbi:acyl-CoA dehydrogenase family protein [Rhodococcus sp. 077-4]|uniref:acyl-CoA dehydrogenase family protein n=1 Tax=Rhodococcus sp. 077-4 TaxID=2789271 RepID=UPI0039F59D2B
MKFTLDSTHLDFAASIDAMLSAVDVPKISRALSDGELEPVRKLWKALAELGVTGLAVDPEFDGLGASTLDVVVAVERLGRWAVPGPVVESIVAVPALLRELANADQHGALLTGLSGGDLVATLAVDSVMPLALDAAVADATFVVAGQSVSAAEVLSEDRSVDPSRRLATVGTTGPTWKLTMQSIDHVADRAALATAAQLIGAGQRLLETTVDYARQRHQFGKPIGTFQAIKHLLADVMIAVELARPLLFNAALSIDRDAPTARRDVSAAKVACADAAYAASRTALQVHGAIGYTLEFDLSLWITKVRALQSAWGTSAVHRGRVMEAL